MNWKWSSLFISLYIRWKFFILKNNIAIHKKNLIRFSKIKKSFFKKKEKKQKTKINIGAKPNLKSGIKLSHNKILKKERENEIYIPFDWLKRLPKFKS